MSSSRQRNDSNKKPRRARPALFTSTGSSTKRASTGPCLEAARRAGLSLKRRSRRNHMTAAGTATLRGLLVEQLSDAKAIGGPVVSAQVQRVLPGREGWAPCEQQHPSHRFAHCCKTSSRRACAVGVREAHPNSPKLWRGPRGLDK